MDGMIEMVNDKPRKIAIRGSRKYIRVGVEFEVETYRKFSQKCEFFGKNVSDGLRELMLAFNNNFGINNDAVRDPGSLFDPRASRHIQVAAIRATQEIASCPQTISEN